jgi:hypothetical protein
MHRPIIIALAALTLGTATLDAQANRRAITVGATWLNFESLGGTLAATAQLRVQRSAIELAGFGVMPIGVTAAVADCIPGAPCPQLTTPSALYGALLSLTSGSNSAALRASIGGGFLGSSGLDWPGDHSSPAVTASLDWAPVRAGLTFTAGVRVVALTSRVASLRGIVLPTVGVSF